MRFNPFPRERLHDPYMPLVAHVTDTIILFDDSSVFALLEVHGLPWETFDPYDVIRQHLSLNDVYWNIARDSLVFYVYQCRGMSNADVYPRGTFSIPFAQRLDDAYRDNLFDNSLYNNRIFLGVMLRPTYLFALEEKVAGAPKPTPEATEARVQQLEDICALLLTSLAVYKPRRIGRRKNYSKICETLVYAMTGLWRAIPITNGRLGDSLFAEDIHVGREIIEYRAPGESWYGAMFGMRHYMEETPPGVLDRFLTASYRCTVFHSYRFISTQAAQELTQKKSVSFRTARDTAKAQADDLVTLAGDLRGHEVMGDHCLSLLVFADTVEAMRQVATAAWADFQNCGARVTRERGALEAALFSLCPGNLHLRPRPAYLRSSRFTAMVPFHAYPTGQRTSYWGEPIAVLRTVSGEPYWLHLHPPNPEEPDKPSDLGGVFVTGMSGSGKTLFLGFLLSQSGRLGAQIILGDMHCGLKILVHELGGTYLELKNPTGLAPLKALQATEVDFDFLIDLIRGCILSDDGAALTPEEDRRLALGLRKVMALPPDNRWMEEIRAFLGVDPNGAGARLEKWCWGKELGWIIDNPKDLLSLDAPIIAYDKTYILDHRYACGPVMATLYHRTGKLADGRRIIHASDEVWKDLSMPAFEGLIANQLKAIQRKGNSPTIFLTQSPRDALRSALAHTIKEQCPTHIHFAPGNASWEDFRDLGRTESEFEIIRSLQPATGWCLISQNKISVHAQLLMHGLENYVSVISGRFSSVKLFNELQAKGEQHRFQEQRLLERVE